MTDDLLTSDEVRAILRVERTALARYLVGPDRIPHLRLGNPRTGPLRIRRSALEEWIRRREEETGDKEARDRLAVPPAGWPVDRPAADEARCVACGDPRSDMKHLPCGRIDCSHTGAEWALCHPFQPAPTPAPPTPPATEPSARTVADCDDHHVSGMLGFCPRCGLGDATEDYPAQHPPAPGLPAALVEHYRHTVRVVLMADGTASLWCRSCDQYLDALAARSAGSGSRVEALDLHALAESAASQRALEVDAEYRALRAARPTPPPAGATQVPLPATDSTPPPAVDGTRCAECGGVKDDVFHARAGASVTTPADPFCTDTWVQGEEARP